MLLETITSHLNTALKTQDKLRLWTLRLLVSEIKKYAIDAYPPGSSGQLTDADVWKIIKRQVKTHTESIAAFAKGNRMDLVEKEKAELSILKSYLPEEISDQEILSIVIRHKINGITKFPNLMRVVMPEIAGRAGGDRVMKIVKENL